MHGCNADGSLNDSEFSRPLPLIGLYVALFSLACAVLMAMDLIEGFRHRRLWFPSRFFPLNAATLTLLGVAVKLPVDLNNDMPGRWDQLAKVSGAVLVCTVMGNIMPSLGVTDNVFSNTFALAILVITVIGNVVAQISTGVIYVFRQEHFILLSFMLVLLAITFSSALTVSTMKHYLEQRYNSIYSEQKTPETISVEFLQRSMDKYWLMAHTCSPQYVLGRSATCTASGALCLLSALVLIEAVARSFLQESLSFCSGKSDYKWSTTVVLVSQAIAILLGTVAPAWRCLSAISFRDREVGGLCNIKQELTVEKYWVQKLKEWKASPLPHGIRYRQLRKVGHRLRNLFLATLIAAQVAVVIASKFVRLLSLWLASCFYHIRRLPRVWKLWSSWYGDLEAAKGRGAAQDPENLSRFVLHLEGEEQLVQLIMRSGRRDSQKLIKKGQKQQPGQLVGLLAHSTPGFRRVGDCGISTTSEMYPDVVFSNCWALPIVTLASIALAIPGIEAAAVKSLRRNVGEGLRYVRLVGKNLDTNGLVNAQEAADVVWETVDLCGRWFGRQLRRPPGTRTRLITEELEQMGRDCVRYEEMRGWNADETDPLEWPPRVLAGICMQSIARAIGEGTCVDTSPEGLFEWLRGAIADKLGACLTNLPRAIHMECFCSEVEVREERVREAAVALGESSDLLSFLERTREEDGHLYPKENRESIDAWASMGGTEGEAADLEQQNGDDRRWPSPTPRSPGQNQDVELGPSPTQ